MISLRLIGDTEIVLNSNHIEFMEATPDTVISLSNGKKMIVQESVSEIIDRIVEFNARIGVLVEKSLRKQD